MLKKSLLNKIKALLLKEKDEILKHIASDSDVVDSDGDETDEVQANQLIEMRNQINARYSVKINKIEEALQHIYNSSYGLCQDCEEEIPDKRLLANPHVQTCVMCAEEREAEEKQRKKP
jgi:DnaK suppressor protein